ncbi:MAG: hypothetical protein ABR588_05145 [Sphingomicrobium sp.]|nr:hypothetical protein [Sphingomonadales bacterium]
MIGPRQLALTVAASVVLTAATAPAPHAAAAKTYVVTIDKLAFGPVPASVRAGDIIVWRNRDLFRHTATARNGSFNVDLPPRPRGARG